MLFRASLGTLRDHLDADDPVLVGRVFASHGVQHLAIRTAEGHANQAVWCRDQAEILAIRTDHLHAGIAGHVQAARCIEGTAIAVAAAFQLPEFMLVGERAILLHIELRHRRVTLPLESA